MGNTVKANLEAILSNEAKYSVLPEFSPKDDDNIKAIAIDGYPYHEKRVQVFAYYGKPKEFSGKTAAILLIHGGGGHAFYEWVKAWTERGFTAIAIDTVGHMPVDEKCLYIGNDNSWAPIIPESIYKDDMCLGLDNDAIANHTAPTEDQWMYHALSAAALGLNIMRRDNDVDPNSIGVTGISWGGVITSLLIGYINTFAFAVPVYGAGYLDEGLGIVDSMFRSEGAKKHWLAQDRFPYVNFPVLWLGWDDDRCFSLDIQDKSYADTKKNNTLTRLSHKHDMKHNHQHGWAPIEIERFAVSILNKCDYLPELLCELKKDSFTIEVRLHAKDEVVKNVTIYYITEPMTFTECDKFGEGQESLNMTQHWVANSVNYSKNQREYPVPSDAAGYYVSVTTHYRGDEYVVSTEYFKTI